MIRRRSPKLKKRESDQGPAAEMRKRQAIPGPEEPAGPSLIVEVNNKPTNL